eukprot:7350874-Prymnesium_polylepis.1
MHAEGPDLESSDDSSGASPDEVGGAERLRAAGSKVSASLQAIDAVRSQSAHVLRRIEGTIQRLTALGDELQSSMETADETEKLVLHQQFEELQLQLQDMHDEAAQYEALQAQLPPMEAEPVIHPADESLAEPVPVSAVEPAAVSAVTVEPVVSAATVDEELRAPQKQSEPPADARREFMTSPALSEPA